MTDVMFEKLDHESTLGRKNMAASSVTYTPTSGLNSGRMVRVRTWIGILVLTLLAVSLAPRRASAQLRANRTISSVLAPVPPGGQPGGGILLQALVRPLARPSTVMFYLAQHQSPGPGDFLIATTSVNAGGILPLTQTLQVTATIPEQVPPGLYFVLACAAAGRQCVATRATIQVLSQALSPTDQSPGTTFPSPPFTEYFPESPSSGMTIGQPFACPFSIHGQWPGSCVYVTTKAFDIPENVQLGGLMYCPKDRPYPYQVAIGFDPLWLDKTVGTVGARTNAVSFTKYKVNDFRMPYSFAGFNAELPPPNRGYAAFFWVGCSTGCGGGTGQVAFLCSDKATSHAAP